MGRLLIVTVSLAAFIAFGCSSYAEEPLTPAGDKLFGIVFPEGMPDAAGVEAYDKSALTAAFVRAYWGKIEPKCTQDGQPEYDFASLENAPFAKSSKTRICLVDLSVPWAGEVRTTLRLRQLAERFVTALAKHANQLGINRFWLSADSYDGAQKPKTDYVADLKSFYSAVKSAGKDNLVFAGPFQASDEALPEFLKTGGKDIYDVLVIDASSDDPRIGIDPVAVYRVRGQMVAAGGAVRSIFVVAPVKEPLESRIENAYRNLLTARDFYDPQWVAGAAMMGYVDTSAFDEFPPRIPAHKFEGTIKSTAPVFNYIAGKPYELNVKFTNLGEKEVKLEKFGVSFPDARGLNIDVKSPDQTPLAAAAKATAETQFTLTFPKEAIGKTLMVRADLEYSVDGKSHFTDAYCPALVVGELELTLLPQRVILGPEDGPKPVGLSVINHEEKLFTGDVVLTPYSGIKTSVTKRKMVIDPFGLDAFVFNVEKQENTAPGHYAILVDVGGKLSDWVAVDVALPVKTSSGKITVDGDLSDWKGVAAVRITRRVGEAVEPIGNGWFAYDDSNLYIAFETDESKRPRSGDVQKMTERDNIVIAIDPLVNGAATAEGGYRDDDYEYVLEGTDSGPAVRLAYGGKGRSRDTNAVPVSFKHQQQKNIYEIAFPWSAISPLNANHTGYFGVSVALNRATESQPDYAEWGGGIVSNKDPRAFIPAILVK